jgi:DNA-binding LacI/PurR family transcriptional regulator
VESTATRHADIEILYADGGFHLEEAFSAVKHVFLDGGQRDAVLAESRYAALGAMRAMVDLKIQVPEKVQLICLGGTGNSAYMVPRMTTIASEAHRLGREAARMAVTLSKPCCNILTPVSLIQGETTRFVSSSLPEAIDPVSAFNRTLGKSSRKRSGLNEKTIR